MQYFDMIWFRVIYKETFQKDTLERINNLSNILHIELQNQ
jgi:hypothetical protein